MRRGNVLRNSYGPTETTITVTQYNCAFLEGDVVPIGAPIFNTSIYILDKNLNQLPIGTTGELYIGGVSLARGYFNKPHLTAEKFISNPFATNDSQGSRLYRTGDLGRYFKDGNIEFLGRVDHQVKIRGFRIELGEIESVIQSLDIIEQTAVLCRGDTLVAYAVSSLTEAKLSDKHKQSLAEIIRSKCSEKLPKYMCPAQIVLLDNMPFTLNGKIDRKALPFPKGREGLGSYQKPVGIKERKLSGVWSNLLGIEKIGRKDNYFSLGGDSIISIQMVSMAQSAGILITVKQVFETPTIEGLALNSEEEPNVNDKTLYKK